MLSYTYQYLLRRWWAHISGHDSVLEVYLLQHAYCHFHEHLGNCNNGDQLQLHRKEASHRDLLQTASHVKTIFVKTRSKCLIL